MATTSQQQNSNDADKFPRQTAFTFRRKEWPPDTQTEEEFYREAANYIRMIFQPRPTPRRIIFELVLALLYLTIAGLVVVGAFRWLLQLLPSWT